MVATQRDQSQVELATGQLTMLVDGKGQGSVQEFISAPIATGLCTEIPVSSFLELVPVGKSVRHYSCAVFLRKSPPRETAAPLSCGGNVAEVAKVSRCWLL